MSDLHPVQIAKRLVEAVGYLELGMPQHALARLESLVNTGQFEAAAQFLRGQALQAQNRFDEAVGPLTLAAEMLPSPLNRTVLLELSACYRRAGCTSQAVNMLGHARGASLAPVDDESATGEAAND
jgi:tetratricopeptide (TPR) repeat protein